MTYPFASLPSNLAAFCAMLRSDYHFRTGPRELHDAARALELTELADERAMRDALRPVLASRLEDVRVFDQAFDRFFARAGAGMSTAGTPSASHPLEHEHQRSAPANRVTDRSAGTQFEDGDAHAEEAGSGAVHDVEDAVEDTAAGLMRARYSPAAVEGPALVLDPADRAWREAAVMLVNRVRAGQSRRWRPAKRGQRFDLRRTLRTSLHTGGDVVLPKWRARPRRRPRFVVMIDGSRSMEPYVRPALQAAVALAGVTANIEAFTFSTALSRVTRDVRRAARGERRYLELHDAWGGGTTIGACLREFLQKHAERVLGRDTLVIIASDGLDVGDPRVLRDAVGRISRLAAALVWLNPLMTTPGYEPTARGMSVARPYVTTLAWVPNAASLAPLARRIRLK